MEVFAPSDESGFQQFFHVFFGGLYSLLPLMSQLLLHGFVAWFYVKFVTHDTCRDARNFISGKSEDVAKLGDGGHDILLVCIRKIFPYFDVFSFEHFYLLVSFYWLRPFVRVGVL